MAVVNHLNTIADTGGAPNTSGAFTPTAGALLVVLVMSANSDDLVDVTLVGDGGVNFEILSAISQFHSGNWSACYAFVAKSPANAWSQTVTFDQAIDAADGTVISVLEVTGVTRYGIAAIRQQAEYGEANNANTTPAVTFANAVLTGNPTIAIVGNRQNPASITEPTGWTEHADVGEASPDFGASIVSRASGFTGTTITWGANSTANYGVIGIEIDTSDPEAEQTLIYIPKRDNWSPQFTGNDGTPEYLDYAYAPVTSYPLTMAAWITHRSPTDGSDNICQLNQSGNSGYVRLGLGDAGGINPRIRASDGSEAFGPPGGGIRANIWHSVFGIATTSYMRMYLDGQPGNDDTSIGAFPITPDEFSIGYENDSSPTDPWPGGIMWVAVWDAELYEWEADQFASGVCPLYIRRQNLKFFAPLDKRSGFRDLISGTIPVHVNPSNQWMKGPTKLQSGPAKFAMAPRTDETVVIDIPFRGAI